jgi:DNA-binding PadR family transcriptional regulator
MRDHHRHHRAERFRHALRHGHHAQRWAGIRRGAGRAAGPGGKVRRGEARYVLLDALRTGPKHGYEIIKALEERSSGRYAPSPGTVYPTLQYLEDMGLVRAEQEAERRTYHLTAAGRTELAAREAEVQAFWQRLEGPAPSAASQAELGFLQDDMDQLTRTVWGGLQGALDRDDHGTIRRVRQAIEHCQQEVRRIIADPGSNDAASSRGDKA